MNWTEPRKSQKSSEHNFSASKKIQTTCLNTPLFDRDYKSGKHQHTQTIETNPPRQKNCPYHFNIQDHICLTCRKSICVRCAITYCQNHTIKQQKEIIPTLIEDLHKIYIRESIDEIETKLGQSLQRQDYFENKVLRLIQKVQQNFGTVIETLNKKKLQIISYFDQQFQKYLSEYREYDQILKKKLIGLSSIQKEWTVSKFEPLLQSDKFTIEKIDQVSISIKNDSNILKAQRKLNSIMLGKSKLSMEKLWSQENLEKLLYEIENIPFRIGKDMVIPHVKTIEKKKRIITESSEHQCKPTTTHKSPMPKNIKGSGRIIYNKFNSGRKSKEERLQKSEML